MKVAALRIHPLKGGRAIAVERAQVGPLGLEGDRRWMTVDPAGRFVTQRELPALATLAATAAGPAALDLAQGHETHAARATGERMDATIWRSTVSVARARETDDAWLSERMSRDLRLVHFDADSDRQTNQSFAPGGVVSLADGYPVLIASEASLLALNDDIVAAGGEAVPMDRFRPNIVISGGKAWDEDSWSSIEIGDVVIDLVKPCDRCSVTTVAQDEGRFAGDEPLATLRRTRRSGDSSVPGFLFGWNAVARGRGTIAVGADVAVASRRAPWPIGRTATGRDLPF